jgi:hypothetical protein
MIERSGSAAESTMTNLQIPIKLNSADLRIGAAKDALDRAKLAAPEGEVIDALLFGEVAARAGSGHRCNVLLQRAPLRFDHESLRTALEGMSTGDCIAYAIALNASSVARLAMLATLPLRLRRVERTIARGGAQIVGRYGIDPSLEAPSCVYELNSPASEYADRCLRPRGAAQALRRILARRFACDPALGGIVILGKKL